MGQHDQLQEEVRDDGPAPDPSAEQPETASPHPKEGASPEPSPHNEEGAASNERLLAKTEEWQALNDKYLRLAADFENYKRRAQRDRGETVRFANETLLRDILPTLDNLERAIQSGREQGTIEGLIEGIDLTYKHCLDTLQKTGVTQFSGMGKVFDPARHQAVGQVESATVPENVVVDEHQKGYSLHDRILRPAMVTVARAKQDATEGEAQPPKEGAES